MKPYLTIGMLVISNIFMTFAWYGQLHLRGQRWFDTLPQLLVIVFCWSIAFFEYIFLVPANRIGFQGTASLFPLGRMYTRFSTVLWDCPTTYHSFEILRFQLQFHTLLREMAGSPQLMCIHNVKHDWFSDSAVPHNTRHIALHDIVFRTS